MKSGRQRRARFAVVVACLLSSPAGGQSLPLADYLPLAPGNEWQYVPAGPQPSVHAISDSVLVGDTLYYVIKLPSLPSDTLRVAEDGSIHARHRGRDHLLLDFSAAAGSTYVFPGYPDGDEPWLDYEVTVFKNLSVDVPAGTFHDGISFTFDAPGILDEELYVTLAPGIGIVSAATAWMNLDLWLARIGEKFVPPLDATVPDTLDWRSYFPMEVGNAWEYWYRKLHEPDEYWWWEIVGDTVLNGEPAFVQRTSVYDLNGELVSAATTLLYYDQESRSIGPDWLFLDFACDLGTAFPVPQHGRVAHNCTDGPDVDVSGGYVDGILLLGEDTLRYPAWKEFAAHGPSFPFLHGIGLPGWGIEGSNDSVHLIYARLGGVSYGKSVIATSIQQPDSPVNRSPAFSVYPIPFADEFVFELHRFSGARIRLEIIDVLGRRVFVQEVGSRRTTVDSSELSPGVYVFRLWADLQILETRPIIKARRK